MILNSLTDFEHYTEIRPITSIGVVLSWIYLIRFKNKRVPEKQEINISFGPCNADGDTVVTYGNGFHSIRGYLVPSTVFLRINHTDRTWGVDIESLLTGQVKTLIKTPPEAEAFISRHSDAVGFSAGTAIFLGAITGVFLTSSRFIESYLAKVHALAIDATNSPAAFASKLDFLIEIISTGAWPRFIFAVIVFLVISLILSIVLGSWVGTRANNKPRSYVLLSKTAEEQRTKIISKIRRDWLMFCLSIAVSIITGIVSNLIFAKYFGGIAASL